MLLSQKIDAVEMDSKKRWMSAAVWSFFRDTVWTNGVDFGVGLDGGGHKGGKLLNWGAGSKNCCQNGCSMLKSKIVPFWVQIYELST